MASWLDGLIYGVRRILGNGTEVAARTTINFIGATVTDNPGEDRTDVTFTGGDSEPGSEGHPAARGVIISNVALSGSLTHDGVVYANMDRALVVGQTAPAENGVYIVNTSGAWSRSTDADVDPEIMPNLTVWVSEGTAYADTLWVCTTNGTIVIGSTAITFERTIGATSIKVGNTLSVDGTTRSIAVGDASNDANVTYKSIRSRAGSGSIKQGLYVQENITSGTDSLYTAGAYLETRFTGSASGASAFGLIQSVKHESSGTLTNAFGLYPNFLVDGTGTKGAVDSVFGVSTNLGFGFDGGLQGSIGTLYGINVNPPNNVGATRTIGTAYGCYISDMGGTGVTTAYGLRLEGQSGAGTNWSIYSTGASGVHSGKFRFGDTTAPTIELEIAGANTVAGLALANGQNLPVSASGEVRYRNNAGVAEVSQNGGAYATIATGAGASPGVQDDGTVVRLVTTSDTFAVGATTMAGSEKVRIVGFTRTEVTGLIATVGTGSQLINTTAADGSNPKQYSPALVLTGQGWSGAASQPHDWGIVCIPSSGGGVSELQFFRQLNGGGYASQAALRSDGKFTATNLAATSDVQGAVSVSTPLLQNNLSGGGVLHIGDDANTTGITMGAVARTTSHVGRFKLSSGIDSACLIATNAANLSVGNANEGVLRYQTTTQHWQTSENAGPWLDVGTDPMFADDFTRSELDTDVWTETNIGTGGGSLAADANGVWLLSSGAVVSALAEIDSIDIIKRSLNPVALFRIQAAPTGTNADKRFKIGFYDTGATEAAYFEYDVGDSANWQCVTVSSSTATETVTSTAVGTTAFVELRIEFASAQVRFYINNTLVATNTTNLPVSTTLLHCYVAVENLDSAVKTISLDRVRVYQDRQA